ncbi:MAG: recombinase RecA [Clostridia bacterium]|nr:recombinase RecA [Clostridia bacterium]
MAEKKKAATASVAESKQKALEMAMQQIEKSFGKGSIMRLGDNAHMQVDAIPTGSLMLDRALGIGGLPRGRIVEIYGPEASGKTTLALHAVAEAQKLSKETGEVAAYIDVEHALDPIYAKALGVDIDSLLVSQPDSAEQALEIAENLIRSGAVSILVIDSVAALVPRAEIEGDMGDAHVGLQARMMSQAMRKLAGVVSKANCVAVFINQLRLKVGVVYGNPEVTAGGNALKYYASVRLDVRRAETLKASGQAYGSHTRVKVVKNKVAPPFKEAEFDIIYGEGISRMGELLDLAVDMDIIVKSGAWFSYGENRIAQGRDNAREYLKNNPDVAAEVEAKVKEMLSRQDAKEKESETVAKAQTAVEIPIEDAPRVTAAQAKASIDIVVED